MSFVLVVLKYRLVVEEIQFDHWQSRDKTKYSIDWFINSHIPTLKVLCNSSIVRCNEFTCCCSCSERLRSLSSDLVNVSEDCFSNEYRLETLCNSAEEWRTFSWYCRFDSSSNWHWLWSSVTLAVRTSSLEWAVWASDWTWWSCFWREW